MTTADTSERPYTISTDRVGRRTIATTTELTTRRLLAFAAGIGEWAEASLAENARQQARRYSDDLREGGLIGHPGLIESLMWNARHVPDDDTDPRAIPFGVHAMTDWRFNRPFREGDVITTQGEVISVRQIPPGVINTTRYSLRDSRGDEVAVIDTSGISRGLRTDGADRVEAESPPLPERVTEREPLWSKEVLVAPEAAHLYTECADIWNPIHTERGFARNAGLPDPILHGSYTFVISVRELLREFLDNDAERLRRVAGQFRAMAMPGEPITVRVVGRDGDALFWETANAQGDSAIANGVLIGG